MRKIATIAGAVALAIAAAASASAFVGSKAEAQPAGTAAGCLPAGKTGTVLRMRVDKDANRNEAVALAVRLKGGTVLTCVGDEPNSVLRAGDVIDGKSLRLHGAARA